MPISHIRLGLLVGTGAFMSEPMVPSRFFRKFEFNRLETNLDS